LHVGPALFPGNAIRIHRVEYLARDITIESFRRDVRRALARDLAAFGIELGRNGRRRRGIGILTEGCIEKGSEVRALTVGTAAHA